MYLISSPDKQKVNYLNKHIQHIIIAISVLSGMIDNGTDWWVYLSLRKVEEGLVFGPIDPHLLNLHLMDWKCNVRIAICAIRCLF